MGHTGQPELPTTTAGDSARAGAIVILRWVLPRADRVTVLGGDTVSLGRDPACTTELPSSRVSRRHAEIGRDAGGVFVTDLASRNGVFVNGERTKRSPLGVGDVLRLGDCLAVVEAVTPAGLATEHELGFGILGGPSMRAVWERAKAAAASAADALLVGEAGVGKELVARAMHRARALAGPFVSFDASLDGLGELVGWTHGARAGLASEGRGYVRAAEHGTLLLRHVEELPLPAQRELLTRLETRTFAPLGSAERARFDVQIVVAAEPPFSALGPERLLPALAQRLSARQNPIPPLRERRADIVPLFVACVGRVLGGAPPALEPELLELVCLEDGLLNVDELASAARRLCAAFPHERELARHHWYEVLGARAPVSEADRESSPPPRRTSAYPPDEITALKAALERHRGNLTKAAHELGITRPRAYRMLKAVESDR
jgi:DNA-binding NtrC family response regulator